MPEVSIARGLTSLVADEELRAKKYANNSSGKAQRAADQVVLQRRFDDMRKTIKKWEEHDSRQKSLKRKPTRDEKQTKRAKKAVKIARVCAR